MAVHLFFSISKLKLLNKFISLSISLLKLLDKLIVLSNFLSPPFFLPFLNIFTAKLLYEIKIITINAFTALRSWGV